MNIQPIRNPRLYQRLLKISRWNKVIPSPLVNAAQQTAPYFGQANLKEIQTYLTGARFILGSFLTPVFEKYPWLQKVIPKKTFFELPHEIFSSIRREPPPGRRKYATVKIVHFSEVKGFPEAKIEMGYPPELLEIYPHEHHLSARELEEITGARLPPPVLESLRNFPFSFPSLRIEIHVGLPSTVTASFRPPWKGIAEISTPDGMRKKLYAVVNFKGQIRFALQLLGKDRHFHYLTLLRLADIPAHRIVTFKYQVDYLKLAQAALKEIGPMPETVVLGGRGYLLKSLEWRVARVRKLTRLKPETVSLKPEQLLKNIEELERLEKVVGKARAKAPQRKVHPTEFGNMEVITIKNQSGKTERILFTDYLFGDLAFYLTKAACSLGVKRIIFLGGCGWIGKEEKSIGQWLIPQEIYDFNGQRLEGKLKNEFLKFLRQSNFPVAVSQKHLKVPTYLIETLSFIQKSQAAGYETLEGELAEIVKAIEQSSPKPSLAALLYITDIPQVKSLAKVSFKWDLAPSKRKLLDLLLEYLEVAEIIDFK